MSIMSNIFTWMSCNVDMSLNKVFTETIKYADKLPYDEKLNWILNIYSQQPDEENKELYSQYFTPPDVSIYTAYNLLKYYPVLSKRFIIFDAGFGNGHLLIASGLVLALQYGFRNDALLEKLHGCEICISSKEHAITNLINALKPYISSLSYEAAVSILKKNLITCDFHDYEFSNNYKYIIIVNPPFKEDRQEKSNLWITFINKILSCDNLDALGAILPVSVSCSDRAASIRNSITEKFSHVMALHHEIRPQPLFRDINQRISILICSQSVNNRERVYETTGFLMHNAGKREDVWKAKYSKIPYEYCQKIFPKPHIDDLAFMYKCMNSTLKIKDINIGDEIPLWIRISGRYNWLAQYHEPDDKESSKWKQKIMPYERAQYIIAQFANGNLLRWLHIFGDGRDLSIPKFFNNFPASI